MLHRNKTKSLDAHKGIFMLSRNTHASIVALCLLLLGACGGGGGGNAPPPIPAPTITQQPAGLTVNAGQPATFTVAAGGATGYQWQRNGQNIVSATSASYTLTPATSQNNGDSYTVVASNSGGTVTSSAAALRVTGISIIAGQIGGEGYLDGPGTQARFWGPVGLALDLAGNLYVADYNAVRKITPAGVVSTVVGSPRVCGDQAGKGPTALLCFPYSVAVDGAGFVYAVDGLSSVWQIDSAGFMRQYASVLGCAAGLAATGTVLYVSDGCGGIISTVQGGVAAPIANVAGKPIGLSLDNALNLYVANDAAVQEVAPTGSVTTLAGTPGAPGSADGTSGAAQFGCARSILGFAAGLTLYNGASGIATTSSTTSYVSDYCHNTIRTVTTGGLVKTVAGSLNPPGAADANGTSAQFWGPAGLVADPSGNVYVADYLNGLIRKITPTGDVSTYAGMTPHAGSADGAASQASFRYPFGVVADGSGNLYVSDSNNHTIRKITPAGIVSTLAGSPAVFGSADGTGAAARFFVPLGLAIDTHGNLYVADSQNETIRKITSAGVVTTLAGMPGVAGSADGTGSAARFNTPAGVAVDPSGNVFVADFFGVRQVTAAGVVTTLNSTLRNARALTISPSGMLYVTAGLANGGMVYSVSTSGTTNVLTAQAGKGYLQGIVMGGDGNLYVSDRNFSTINKVTLSGTVSTAVSSADLPIGTVPGGLPGKINSPTGLALLSTGTSVSLAVVDSFEHAVLRVDLP
jgi:sugar lactone lactonase YvrE